MASGLAIANGSRHSCSRPIILSVPTGARADRAQPAKILKRLARYNQNFGALLHQSGTPSPTAVIQETRDNVT
jgi:hypothetical protein